MLFAGHDTTAITLAWVVHELTRRPDVENRLVGELRAVMGDAWMACKQEQARAPDADELGHLR